MTNKKIFEKVATNRNHKKNKDSFLKSTDAKTGEKLRLSLFLIVRLTHS